jgi:hypothetical protein
MMRSLHVSSTLDAAIKRATVEVSRSLEASHLATIGTKMLRQVDPDAQRVGSKPLLTLADAEQRRYVLKAGEPALNYAEEAAYKLRRLGGRPGIPSLVACVQVEGLGRVEGLVKPYVDFDTSLELDSDTTLWTELQRGVMLLEHAWEWFLDNLDTNPSQYALFGERGYPVNVDWDRAFASEGRSELSRFAKYKSTLPNARTFLYADYVEGRIDLPFKLLIHEARRIRRLPVQQVRAILKAYAKVHYSDSVEAHAFVRRMIERQQRIEQEVSQFVRSLRAERRALAQASPDDRRAWMRRRAVLLWDQWQIVLNSVLRGPVGTCGRLLLKFTRRGSLRVDPDAQLRRVV